MTATKSRPVSSSTPSGPFVDAAQAAWTSRELESLIAQLGNDSPVAMVLRHARREILSLTASVPAGSAVVGPLRIAA